MSEKYTFRARDFYELLTRQGYRCAISGIELTPENTTAEHIVPLRKGGKHELANIYLVDENISRLKRNLLEEEVIEIARRIVEHEGKKKKKSSIKAKQRTSK